MNKTAIKNFAIWARNKLIADISYKAGLLGITDKDIKTPLPQSTKDAQYFDIGSREPYQITGVAIGQRQHLAEKINERSNQSDYATAYKTVIEEVAYTWFNRLIAVRFMEVNDYLPSRVRVLSGTGGKTEPDIVTTPFDTDLEFSQTEREYIIACKNDNKLDELFRMLFIKQCNALNTILPELFERIGDYTELLMNISFTDKEGVVYRIVHGNEKEIISEDDFKETVEIIGWLYQYYNTEPKDETFALLKKNVKITKERIPAATQLFTPDWIVRYMVENSLGRLWLEGIETGDYKSPLRANWKYYLDEAEQTPEVQAQLEKIRAERRGQTPEDITFIDPCMGSGHILVYAFDVFMQIYESAGYSQRDAARLIIEKNIHGLDIDKRAYQLAYFGLMMKARQYNRRIFDGSITPQVYHPVGWGDGEEFGSLNKIARIERKPEEGQGQSSLFDDDNKSSLMIWNFKRLLSQKYDVVVTNPPYMGGSGMNGRLAQHLKDNYPDSKTDLFAAFIERCASLMSVPGINAIITQHSWMFLSSYEKLRQKLRSLDIASMVHLGAKAFAEIGGEVVQCTAFVVRNGSIKGYKGMYVRLVDFDNADQKEAEFLSGKNRYTASSDNFAKIPGMPISYWASENMLRTFERGELLGARAKPKSGQNTGNNERFVRVWHEVSAQNSAFPVEFKQVGDYKHLKWIPYNKGGEYRKWYGNFDRLVNWADDGSEVKSYATGRNNGKHWSRYIQNIDYLYKEGITWSVVTSGRFSVRYLPVGFICDYAGCAVFPNSMDIPYLLGLVNVKLVAGILSTMNPTLNGSVKISL